MPQLDPEHHLNQVNVDDLLQRLKAQPGMDRALRNDLIGALQQLSNLQFAEDVYKNDFIRLNRMDQYARGFLKHWVAGPTGLTLTYSKPPRQSGKIRAAIDALWEQRPKKEKP